MKNVTRARLHPGPSGSRSNRALSILELATSWVDEGGIISPEEGGDRVFVAALDHGDFTVNWRLTKGLWQQFRTRAFPEAVYLCVRLILEGRQPLMYATTHNRYTLLSARSFKDVKTGKWIRRNTALADELQRLLDLMYSRAGIKTRPAPLLLKLRSFIERDQLEWPKEKRSSRPPRERL